MGPTVTPGQVTTLPHAFTAGTLHDLATGAWNMDTGASSHLNASVTSLNDVFNTCLYPSISVGDRHSIPFVTDNNCTVELDAFGFSVKDFMTRRVLLRCDSTRDLYPVTAPSPIPHAFLVSHHTWHQRLGHPRSEVLRHGTLSRYKARLVANGSTQLEGVDETFILVVKPGISVTQNSSGMFLSLKKYVVEILEMAYMVNCNSSQTPVDIESKLGDDGDPVSDPTLYRSLTGSLQYLTFTRLDISYVIQQICVYMHDLREPYFSALKRILRYLRGFPTTQRSTSGYCVFLGNNLLSWSSKRQLTLSRSNAKAEYHGVANAIVETCWLRNLLRELHTPLSSATLVYCDNLLLVMFKFFMFLPVISMQTHITKGLPSTLLAHLKSTGSWRIEVELILSSVKWYFYVECLDDGVAASFQRSRIHKPHAHTQAFKVNPQVDQESQIKMIQVKEMMQDNDLKNSKSKDKGSRSRSQSMNDQSHYKQDKTKTRQSINVKSHILNVIGGTEECEERDLNIGGDC
ncbi:ribonuclease H-like domain-containing protein [Tanacetum coccineum]|uniref:Ribonuclease H-like domain-containing protein n=1 Tax=Tanacetum coccineum TaxID=301880 RepID=A0ABQ4WKH2_9ASTR